MLNSEEHTELIESYLRGTLSTEEAALLEKNAASDLTLKNELDLQKSIIETLRAKRKAELKARLNNIEVSNSTSSNWWKYFAGATIISTIGIWLYMQNRVKDNTNIPQLEVTSTKNIKQQVETSGATPEYHTYIKESKNPATLKTKEEFVVTKKSNKQKNTSNVETLPSVPNIASPQDNIPEPLNKDITAPEGDLTKSVKMNNSLNDLEVIKSKQHKFHYRYFDKKLYLYGNFDSKTYDILELNTSKGQAFYLKFETNYYALEPNKTEISKLEMVTDKNTIAELKEVQKK
jgi:hypothetical protein